MKFKNNHFFIVFIALVCSYSGSNASSVPLYNPYNQDAMLPVSGSSSPVTVPGRLSEQSDRDFTPFEKSIWENRFGIQSPVIDSLNLSKKFQQARDFLRTGKDTDWIRISKPSGKFVATGRNNAIITDLGNRIAVFSNNEHDFYTVPALREFVDGLLKVLPNKSSEVNLQDSYGNTWQFRRSATPGVSDDLGNIVGGMVKK